MLKPKWGRPRPMEPGIQAASVLSAAAFSLKLQWQTRRSFRCCNLNCKLQRKKWLAPSTGWSMRISKAGLYRGQGPSAALGVDLPVPLWVGMWCWAYGASLSQHFLGVSKVAMFLL